MTKAADSILTATVCCLVSGIVYWDSLSYPSVQGQGFGQGPAFYPRVLAGSLLGLGILLLCLQFIGRSAAYMARKESCESTGDQSTHSSFLPYLVVMFLLVFVLLLPWTGFIPAGLLLVLVTAMVIRGKLTAKALFLSLLASVSIICLVWLIFTYAIGIDLPASQHF